MNSSQTTDTILMIRPYRFGFNRETAGTNIFQKTDSLNDQSAIHEKALKEFDDFVKKLREHKIYVIVLQDPGTPPTPDSIFPNNWISFHHSSMILYPMLAGNRRYERRKEWISLIKNIFRYDRIIDLSGFENEHKFLEGTGSMVFDRINRVVYANLSSRTNRELVSEFAINAKHSPVYFSAKDERGNEIYHTNVIMAIGEKVAVLCSKAIPDAAERKVVQHRLNEHHEVVDITRDQMMQFVGNMLLIKNRDGKKFWVMSSQAIQSLNEDQLKILNKDGDFIYSPIDTIETAGGGSARCMMAEVF